MTILAEAILYIIAAVLNTFDPLPPCEEKVVDGVTWGCWSSRASASIHYGKSFDGPAEKACLNIDSWSACIPLTSQKQLNKEGY